MNPRIYFPPLFYPRNKACVLLRNRQPNDNVEQVDDEEVLTNWHNVAEPNGGHRDEREVKALEEAPVLPLCQQHRADGHVAQKDRSDQRNRDGDVIVNAELQQRITFNEPKNRDPLFNYLWSK